MRRILLCLASALAVLALGPALASAANTWCVNDSSCSGDHTWTTISTAITASTSGDTIQIGPGAYFEQPNDSGKALTIVGAGPTKTLVEPTAGDSQTTFRLTNGGSTLSNVGLVLAHGATNTGLMLAGNAHDIAITEPADGTTGGEVGVSFNAAGTPVLSSSTIVLPTSGPGNSHGAQASNVPAGTLQDSSVTAETGISNVLKIARDRITATTGITEEYDSSSISATVDDTLIVLPPGTAGSGMSAFSNAIFGSYMAAIVARHVTVIGNGDPGSTGVVASALSTSSNSSTATISVSSSIIRNVGHALEELASGGGMAATATVAADYSDYDPSTQVSANGGTGASGSIGNGAHVVNVDPKFVATSTSSASDPAAPREFQLQTGSPLIDVGDPAPLAAGESTTDLLGSPRVLAGHAAAAAVTDIGAFEYQPHAPVVTAAASAPSVIVSNPVTFTATGSDPDPGDSLTYSWAFDDGGTGSGASVSHTFTTFGNHSATVTAHDLDNLTASATASVSVIAFITIPPGPFPIPPALAGLVLNPSAFAAAPSGPSALAAAKPKRKFGTAISYRDSEVARTTFTVQRTQAGRRKGRSCVRPTAKLNRRHAKRCTRYLSVGSFTHTDAAGANRLRFTGRINGHKLSPGVYRLQVIASIPGAQSKPSYISFKIVR